ncbi:TLC domain-containing protein 4-like [Phyllostomus hastatus]|uniref:TLC domain-containing protein 4-like n=1 Tax=Phyllostomus hastatus TaxID=9423 RepID=UPI001E684A37|nr:TLC domain-containing protein 4-like [Phyllostomus hastatus]XP_045672422.1 TLC domain-containing protein 4-like [Phyllostomus hastatus]XP_045672423.1 TLC domain-containing protein 4-like [Phyllostomus hastatus]XP_045672424.1 TLC domain-containing protein 4-like [Phyllostomus hastatus]XP_045672425.1 TLC domain-containing protein 4-like [Phyllostomus hastatus]XP_045672426.1 TLC domain-containing protein 4-like [Phyllostomus hastatus]XP_045672428.1 TLC domain-containing protein 4-like [Phyllo
MDAAAGPPAGVLLASFCVFQLLFHVLSPRLSAAVSPGFSGLSSEKKIEWNSRVASTCHSLVVGILGLYIFFFDEATIADPLWGNSSLVKVNVAIASGYLISDLLALLLYWKVIGDKYFVVHHCTALYAFSVILITGSLQYIGNFRLLAELSSPFVNQRWFLETLQYPKFSRANVVNGVLMTAAFFLVRIAAMPPMYGFMYSVVGTEAYARLGPLAQATWAASCLVLDVMNVMWMVKISRGCLKVLSLLRDQKASGCLQNGKLD